MDERWIKLNKIQYPALNLIAIKIHHPSKFYGYLTNSPVGKAKYALPNSSPKIAIKINCFKAKN